MLIVDGDWKVMICQRSTLPSKPGNLSRMFLSQNGGASMLSIQRETVTVTRWMGDVEPPPFWRKNMRDRFPDFEGRVDRWQIIHYYAPGTICIDVGVAEAGTGAPEGDRSRGVNGYVMNTITPETDRSCHYFWAFMRNYRLESQLITTQLRNGVHGVFGEDEAMLQAQQAAIDANPEHEFYNLNIDMGGMWVRRLLERALEAEGRPAAAPAAPAGA